eukprot:1526503-Rhodomonas_salina.1
MTEQGDGGSQRRSRTPVLLPSRVPSRPLLRKAVFLIPTALTKEEPQSESVWRDLLCHPEPRRPRGAQPPALGAGVAFVECCPRKTTAGRVALAGCTEAPQEPHLGNDNARGQTAELFDRYTLYCKIVVNNITSSLSFVHGYEGPVRRRIGAGMDIKSTGKYFTQRPPERYHRVPHVGW